MNLQYLSDDSGKVTGVFIPIKEWNTITDKLEDLKTLETPNLKRNKPSDFVGCISEKTAQEMINDIEISRNQWERTI